MRAMKTGVVSVLAIGLLVGPATSATADDAECVQRAWELPIETMSVPDGLAWDDLYVDTDGLYGTLYRTGRSAATVDLFVWCVHDPAGLIDRNTQLVDHVFATSALEAPASLGPDAIAYRVTAEDSYNRGNMSIQWLRGDLVAEVDSYDLQSYKLLKELAVALDAVLPQ